MTVIVKYYSIYYKKNKSGLIDLGHPVTRFKNNSECVECSKFY